MSKVENSSNNSASPISSSKSMNFAQNAKKPILTTLARPGSQFAMKDPPPLAASFLG